MSMALPTSLFLWLGLHITGLTGIYSRSQAFAILERMRKKVLCFNDDIQGTGAVVTTGHVLSFPPTQLNTIFNFYIVH